MWSCRLPGFSEKFKCSRHAKGPSSSALEPSCAVGPSAFKPVIKEHHQLLPPPFPGRAGEGLLGAEYGGGVAEALADTPKGSVLDPNISSSSVGTAGLPPYVASSYVPTFSDSMEHLSQNSSQMKATASTVATSRWNGYGLYHELWRSACDQWRFPFPFITPLPAVWAEALACRYTSFSAWSYSHWEPQTKSFHFYCHKFSTPDSRVVGEDCRIVARSFTTSRRPLYVPSFSS